MPKKASAVPLDPKQGEELFQRIAKPSYLRLFLLTLELNKIESQNQDWNSPPIFLKVVDDLGVIQSYEVNSLHQGQVSTPNTEFNLEDAVRVWNFFTDAVLYPRLLYTLGMGGLEQLFQDNRTPDERQNQPSMLHKTFDENGLVTAGGINCEVKKIES